MKIFSYKVRVRYCDVDSMGIVYHTRYLDYWEWARTEFIRALGVSYVDIEKSGFLLPCIYLDVSYQKPAFYDDELVVDVSFSIEKRMRVKFYYTIKNKKSDMPLIKGETVHIFTDKNLLPKKIPSSLKHIFF